MTPDARELATWLGRFTRAPKTRLRPYICPFDVLLEFVSPGASIYDVGCGGGAWLAMAAHYRKCRRLGGFDVAEPAVAAARDLVARSAPDALAQLTVEAGDTVPTAARTFDIISVIDVLHHVPPAAQAQFLVELGQRLRPGGRLILKDIDAAHPLVLTNRLHDRLLAGARGHEWSAPAARAALQAAGLTISAAGAQRLLVYPHYWLIAEKPMQSAPAPNAR